MVGWGCSFFQKKNNQALAQETAHSQLLPRCVLWAIFPIPHGGLTTKAVVASRSDPIRSNLDHNEQQSKFFCSSALHVIFLNAVSSNRNFYPRTDGFGKMVLCSGHLSFRFGQKYKPASGNRETTKDQVIAVNACTNLFSSTRHFLQNGGYHKWVSFCNTMRPIPDCE